MSAGMQYRSAPWSVTGDITDMDGRPDRRRVKVEFPAETLDAHGSTFAPRVLEEIVCGARTPSDAVEPRYKGPHRQVCQGRRPRPQSRGDWAVSRTATKVPSAAKAISLIEDHTITDFSMGFDKALSRRHPDAGGPVVFRPRRSRYSRLVCGKFHLAPLGRYQMQR